MESPEKRRRGGLGKKRGIMFLKGVDTPMHTMLDVSAILDPSPHLQSLRKKFFRRAI